MPTVLVIDDDPLVAVSVQEAVPSWTVLEAPDGATGIECVRAHRSVLDLVVLDMIMPHDGVMTCLQIRTEAPGLPILPFTGVASSYAAAATSFGSAPPLFKPASPAALAAALHRALGLKPPPLEATPVLRYLQDGAARSEQTVRLEQPAVLRAVVLASSEVLKAGLRSSVTAAGGWVRYATTRAATLNSGLGSLRSSLLVADSDIQAAAVEVAHTFQLPLLIVARTMAAAYHATKVAQGVVVEPVALRTMGEALVAVGSGGGYHDKLLTVLLAQTSLTKTEQAVAQLLLLGLKDAEIASRLVVAAQTVRMHKMHIFDKLSVATLEELNAWCETERLAWQHA